MTDTSTAAEEARITAETEASREIAASAAPDNPNPPAEASPLPNPPPQAAEGTPAEGAKPLERVTSFDRGRADIAARFKEKRAAQGGQVEFHGDMRDPSQTYGPYPAPVEPLPPAPPTAPQPPT